MAMMTLCKKPWLVPSVSHVPDLVFWIPCVLTNVDKEVGGYYVFSECFLPVMKYISILKSNQTSSAILFSAIQLKELSSNSF